MNVILTLGRQSDFNFVDLEKESNTHYWQQCNNVMY